MTRPGIEPRSPGPLANTLTAGPMSRLNDCTSVKTNVPVFIIFNSTYTYICKVYAIDYVDIHNEQLLKNHVDLFYRVIF